MAALILLNGKPDVQAHVLRKVLSTLSRFFTKFPTHWHECIASTIVTIVTGKPHVELGSNSLEKLCHDLSERDTILCLEFCQILIEDVKNENFHHVHESTIDTIINNNIQHLALLLQNATEVLYTNTKNPVILHSAFKTYGAWALNHPMGSEYIKFLLPVTNFIFVFIQHHPATELYHLALEEISEILNRFPSFYDDDAKFHLAHILGETGKCMVAKIEKKNSEIAQSITPYNYEDDDINELQEDVQSFAKAAIALCELAILNMDELDSSEISTLIEYLLIISGFPGFPNVDNNLATLLLEFWTTYADSILESDDSIIFSHSNPFISKVIEIFWAKSKLPLPEQHESWQPDSWEEFEIFRQDFWTFLNSTYCLVDAHLFTRFVTTILTQLSSTTTDWISVEASLSCINALSKNVSSITYEYSLVAQLLCSPLLEQFSHLDNMHIRTTGVNFVGAYSSFFEEDIGQPYLFLVLDYLFKSLSTSTLSDSASRSIQKLCSSSRSFLSEALPSFFDTYTAMTLYTTLDTASHERTTLAIACLIQAVVDVEKKHSYINQLTTLIFAQLEIVHHDYENSTLLPNGPNREHFRQIVSLLHCLANIGIGLQDPRGTSDCADAIAVQQYWDADKFHIRKHLLEVMKTFALDRPEFKSSLEICDCCCAILKSGFSERHGLFVFPFDTELNFIKAKYIAGPSACYSSIIELGYDFLSTHINVQTTYINSLLDTFFSDLNLLLGEEPDAQTSSLKLLRLIASKYTDVLLKHSKCDIMIHFAIQMLTCIDRVSLREATHFWSTYLNISENKDQQASLANIGPELTTLLINKIAGGSTRSELEFYTEVIKTLLVKDEAYPWLDAALVKSPEHQVERIQLSQRQTFYEQLLHLRGRKETNLLIKQFWLTARGIVDYVS